MKDLIVLFSNRGSLAQEFLRFKGCDFLTDNPKASGIRTITKQLPSALQSMYITQQEPGETREQYCDRLYNVLKEYRLVVLAGFMKILKGDLILSKRILNCHPSTRFIGLAENCYKLTISSKQSMAGFKVHWVTKGLDEGPIVFSKQIEVSYDHDTEETLQASIQALERIYYPLVVQKVLNEL